MTAEKREPITREQWAFIAKQAETMKYGTISLIFQDGYLIQIDRNEKTRFTPGEKKQNGNL